ncbi:MAG: tetratricopeptide repeat protein [Desulfuromonadaceae bacterium]|nr:tetratricopeptide repeat protein [Desulfuromonadaceae bacterium]
MLLVTLKPTRFVRHILLFVVAMLWFAAAAECAQQLRPSEQRGIAQAQQYLERQEYVQAVASLTPLLHRQKHHPLVDFYRGIIAQTQGQYDEAQTWFSRSVAADPELLSGWINLAQCNFQLEEYTDAAHAFERSYALSAPLEPRWRYNAALAWFQAGELENAETLLLHLLQDFPAELALQWRELLVHIYLRDDNLNRKREESNRLALAQVQILAHQSEEPARRSWREYLVHLYLQLNMRSQALEFVTQLLEVEGLDSRWWRVAAHLYLEEQQYRSALVALQVAGYLAPGDEREQRLCAALCMHLGIPAQAIEYYMQLQLMQGEAAEVLLALAQAYVQRHEPQQALQWLEQIDAQEVNIAQLRLRAQILFMLKQYAKAGAAYASLAEQEQNPSAAGRAWMLAAYAAWNAEAWTDAVIALNSVAQYSDYANQAHALLQQLQDVRGTQDTP